MQQDIVQYADDPVRLEAMYRSNRSAFREAFDKVYPSLSNKPLAAFWQARLHQDAGLGSKADVSFWGVVILLGLVSAFLAKVPAIFGVDEEFYLSRYIGFIIFPVLCIYFILRKGLSAQRMVAAAAVMIAGFILISVLPDNRSSDILILACIHLPLLLWAVLGFVFTGEEDQMEGRLSYLKFNGDLVVMTALIGLAFGLMSALTMGLFRLIGWNIQELYMEWIALSCIAAAPVVATHLTQSNPSLVGRVSPVIARIFSPLVLVMLVIYLVAMAVTGKSPFEDRDFLIIFNAMLIGVMAIIFFSVSDKDRDKTPAERWILILLILVTITLNAIALSAIIFRISSWGLTPNRAAVLGGNILIFANLVLVAYRTVAVLKKKEPLAVIGLQIVRFLPVYVAWTAIVVFLFPLMFTS